MAQPAVETIVMKFGGSSVADPDKVRLVAKRFVDAKRQGLDVVGTVSAMGKTTDSLLALASDVSPTPNPRELDMLLSTGERIACALVAMAIHDLGEEAVSFTGSQAGILTDSVHTKAKIREGGPEDGDTPDAELDVWAGHVPLVVEARPPVPDPTLRPGIPVPPGVAHYRRPGLVG